MGAAEFVGIQRGRVVGQEPQKVAGALTGEREGLEFAYEFGPGLGSKDKETAIKTLGEDRTRCEFGTK